jgi:hypothetical protein
MQLHPRRQWQRFVTARENFGSPNDENGDANKTASGRNSGNHCDGAKASARMAELSKSFGLP